MNDRNDRLERSNPSDAGQRAGELARAGLRGRLRGRLLGRLRRWWRRLAARPRIPYVEQTTSRDGAAACLSMVLRHHGKEPYSEDSSS